MLAGKSYGDTRDPSQLSKDQIDSRSKGEPLPKGGLSYDIFFALQKRGMKEQPGLAFDYIRAENELDTILFLRAGGRWGS